MDTILVLATITSSVETTVARWGSPGTLVLKRSAVLLLVLLNGFFVACELAIVKVRA